MRDYLNSWCLNWATTIPSAASDFSQIKNRPGSRKSDIGLLFRGIVKCVPVIGNIAFAVQKICSCATAAKVQRVNRNNSPQQNGGSTRQNIATNQQVQRTPTPQIHVGNQFRDTQTHPQRLNSNQQTSSLFNDAFITQGFGESFKEKFNTPFFRQGFRTFTQNPTFTVNGNTQPRQSTEHQENVQVPTVNISQSQNNQTEIQPDSFKTEEIIEVTVQEKPKDTFISMPFKGQVFSSEYDRKYQCHVTKEVQGGGELWCDYNRYQDYPCSNWGKNNEIRIDLAKLTPKQIESRTVYTQYSQRGKCGKYEDENWFDVVIYLPSNIAEIAAQRLSPSEKDDSKTESIPSISRIVSANISFDVKGNVFVDDIATDKSYLYVLKTAANVCSIPSSYTINVWLDRLSDEQIKSRKIKAEFNFYDFQANPLTKGYIRLPDNIEEIIQNHNA